MTNLDSILKSRDIILLTKVHLVKAMVFPVVMRELDYKEIWALKNWCFWTVVFEKTLESHLDCKEIKPVHPKGDQSWVFIGRTNVEAEAAIIWPPDGKNSLIGKDSWESLGLQGDPTSPSQWKSVLNIQWKDWCWSWNSNTLAIWCKELTHWKRPWC